jgi:HEPN domain-containing protein
MPPKRYPPTDPREWLRRAHSNLALAKTTAPEVCLEDLCFDAQQAAEKAVKAVFIHRGLHFPFVHDFADLLDLLKKGGVKIPKYVLRADELTSYAVETRYPGLASPVTKREYRSAVHVAESILRWAERQIR